jgi:1-acyl-sn-glycerol-3-phosphate acyltransferase
VPVLPCYLEGVPYHEILWRPVFMPARVKLVIGDPIDLSEYWGRERDSELVARLTLECVQEIAKLAGREDFQPQLAGREWKTWK